MTDNLDWLNYGNLQKAVNRLGIYSGYERPIYEGIASRYSNI